jgi:hypothetical protein
MPAKTSARSHFGHREVRQTLRLTLLAHQGKMNLTPFITPFIQIKLKYLLIPFIPFILAKKFLLALQSVRAAR